jgi:hypothetical protein
VLRDRAWPVARLHGAGERVLLLAVLVAAPAVPLLMRLPLPAVERLLTARRPRGPRRGRRLPAERVAAVVEAAQALAHPVVRRGCLTRGVSLFWLLRDRDRDGDLRLCFGIGGPADDFSGHCWLERDGELHLERVDPRARFPKQYTIPFAPGS